jgi:nucleoside-diphosphate-sugar epimerase
MSNVTILVTGAIGNVGSQVVAQLVRAGSTVRVQASALTAEITDVLVRRTPLTLPPPPPA